MSVNDPIGDMLTRIRNAQERGKSKVSTPHSRLRENVLNVLQGEGFIRGYAVVQSVSKPGRRVYVSVGSLPTVYNGLGISILSTPKGVMSDADARTHNVGGEVLCTVF